MASEKNQIQVATQIGLGDVLERHEKEFGAEAVEATFKSIANGRNSINADEWDETILKATARSLKQTTAVNLKLGTRKNALDPGLEGRLSQRFDSNKSKVDHLVQKLEDDLVEADLKLYVKKLAGFKIAAIQEMINSDRELIETAQQPIEDPLLQSLVGNFEEDLLSLAMGA